MFMFLAESLVVGSAFSTTAEKRIKSKSITMHTIKATIGVGDVISLGATMNPVNSTDSITWSTSNKKIAAVNKYGNITAISDGKATITVKTSSNKKSYM